MSFTENLTMENYEEQGSEILKEVEVRAPPDAVTEHRQSLKCAKMTKNINIVGASYYDIVPSYQSYTCSSSMQASHKWMCLLLSVFIKCENADRAYIFDYTLLNFPPYLL